MPVTDDKGNVVRTPSGPKAGQPMLRPADAKYAPNAIVKAGEENYGNMRGFSEMMSNFRQGGEWDAQRADGTFHPEYIDYSTVEIGLYGAAHGMTRDQSLTIQDAYASVKSRYAPGTKMDETYTHLPERNVDNTHLGFDLYESGAVSGGPYQVDDSPVIKPLEPAPAGGPVVEGSTKA